MPVQQLRKASIVKIGRNYSGVDSFRSAALTIKCGSIWWWNRDFARILTMTLTASSTVETSQVKDWIDMKFLILQDNCWPTDIIQLPSKRCCSGQSLFLSIFPLFLHQFPWFQLLGRSRQDRPLQGTVASLLTTTRFNQFMSIRWLLLTNLGSLLHRLTSIWTVWSKAVINN